MIRDQPSISNCCLLQRQRGELLVLLGGQVDGGAARGGAAQQARRLHRLVLGEVEAYALGAAVPLPLGGAPRGALVVLLRRRLVLRPQRGGNLALTVVLSGSRLRRKAGDNRVRQPGGI